MSFHIEAPEKVDHEFAKAKDERAKLRDRQNQLQLRIRDAQRRGQNEDAAKIGAELKETATAFEDVERGYALLKARAVTAAAAAVLADGGYKKLVADAAVNLAARIEPFLPLHAVIVEAGQHGISLEALPGPIQSEIAEGAGWLRDQVRLGTLFAKDLPASLRGLVEGVSS
jgi:hypothetical protein